MTFSNLATVVEARTYARPVGDGKIELPEQTVDRYVYGNVKGHNLPQEEINQLLYLGKTRKAGPGGRGLWYSGSESHERIGGVALSNCWFVTAEDWYNFVVAMDLLMLGGGVGLSIEHRFVSKLPKVKKDVEIRHVASNDADFIVPDSREGWCKLAAKVYEAFFVTGKGFTYSTVCVRGAGEAIHGFGGTASGPMPLIEFVENLKKIIGARAGKFIRPIDAMDIICATGKMVVAGNVRRSAIIILGDPFDKEYLTAKRWDLGPIPAYRQNANLSVVVDDIEDLHPLFWKTYEHGEPYGLINRKNIQTFGRMGEKKKDSAVGVNPCGEATLEPFEPCNLAELALPNITDEAEFEQAARLMLRYTKRVTMERYHHEEVEKVIKRNRRVGIGVTGCLRSSLWVPETLDHVYKAIQAEDQSYSKEMGLPLSIRTTLVKPSGTWSKRADMRGYEGIHAALSRFIIQRVQFGAADNLLPLLREAGHTIEPKVNIDGSLDHAQQVVDFYEEAPEGYPIVDEGFDTWKQLDQVLLAQRWWSDQSVSVTVYYKLEEIAQIKEWLSSNFKYLKTISFLLESGHGFKQAPKEPITAEQYEKLSKKIKPIDVSRITEGGDISSQECAEGYCPVK